MSARRRARLCRAVLTLLTALAVASPLRAQTPAGRLVEAARAQLDELNPDSAATLLVAALAPGSAATACEQLRGLTLLGITELILGREMTARLAFRQALRWDQTLRLDSLTHLHAALPVVFASEKAAAPTGGQLETATLEFRGLPNGTQVAVDGEHWQSARRSVLPGMHRYEITAPGYMSRQDSINVAPCVSVTLDIRLTAWSIGTVLSSALAVSVDIPRDTVISSPDGQLRITVMPTYQALVVITISPAEAPLSVIWADTALVDSERTTGWLVLDREGVLLTPGPYSLRVVAGDAEGNVSQTVEISFVIQAVAVWRSATGRLLWSIRIRVEGNAR